MKTITTKIKQAIWAVPFCLTVLSPLSAHALTVEEVPNPQQRNGTWVTDMADILSQDTERQLNQMISELEIENGTEIAVVTVPETSPAASPKAFTTELFNHWGIGKADEDNGVLFLISIGDRRVEIETGYGIEPILPDAQVGQIIETKITPPFKQGDFDTGTLAGTKALVVQLGDDVNTTDTIQTNRKTTNSTTAVSSSQLSSEETFSRGTLQSLLLFIGVPVGIIVLLAANRKSNRSSKRRSSSGGVSVGSSSCGSCSGGSSSGGGSSGGGGAGGGF
ncbi:conserved domain protein [Coleofasciculus chthonoplastes PCC 7420]|uniref:Conserved domain protein n=1 Tax=Coleofasciculus chthonoplastes PCC 7420 TaxID=118168 RepID=B4VRQ5_9CYAN|nr:TPM domain-containing protein [Coleofasciculus chthonoplastes]EDX75563.1 conserved domain protein [Coleofasciculus chthonoplastes PCC 7420]